MRPEQWAQVKEIAGMALELPQPERQEFVDRACGSESWLRNEVERLLAQSPATMESPVAMLAAAELKPGQLAGHYRVEAKVGGGGMGIVYRAYDTQLRRPVALKVLSPAYAADPEWRARLLREARAASALNHPSIVSIYEVGSAGGVDFIAMELVEGSSLKQLIPAAGMPVALALECAEQIAGALARAHDSGVIHRDLKPANVMVTPKGFSKLLDFGLARRIRTPEGQDTSFTLEGDIAGTPGYMSPEQARGEEVDERSDLFSFGAVLFEMLTGKRAFSGATSINTIDAILHSRAVPLRSLRPEVPVALEHIVERALDKDRSLRYQSANELKADLHCVMRDLAGTTVGQAGGMPEGIRSIAVLPFIDMSAEKDQQYFCDGITEELITSLARIRHLRVAARTSAFSFKGVTADIREIARKLNVQAVVEGSIRKAGGKLRISAQLVNAADGYPLWTGRYDPDSEDIFAVQDGVVAAIVGQLKLTVDPDEQKGVFAKGTQNIQAHALYLEGLNYLWTYSSLGFTEAIRCFEAALKFDCNYAQAYWGLSDAYLQVAFWGTGPPRKACQRVKDYAERALVLDPLLGDAHGSLSYVHLIHDWDLKAAEQEALEAIRLSPNSSMAHSYYSWFLLHAGRHREAVAEALKAQSLDPVSSFISFVVALAFGVSGDYDRAIQECHAGLALNGDFYVLHDFLGLFYIGVGKYAEAISAHERAVHLSNRLPFFVSHCAMACFLAGRKADARALWRELEQRALSEYVRPICFVKMNALLGHLPSTLRWLTKAGEEHDTYLTWMRAFPYPLIRARGEFRVQAAIKKALLNFAVSRTLRRNRIECA